jgi:hypothetical protein
MPSGSPLTHTLGARLETIAVNAHEIVCHASCSQAQLQPAACFRSKHLRIAAYAPAFLACAGWLAGRSGKVCSPAPRPGLNSLVPRSARAGSLWSSSSVGLGILFGAGYARLRSASPPNWSLNRTRYGTPGRAVRLYRVHFRQPALPGLPSRSGELQR